MELLKVNRNILKILGLCSLTSAESALRLRIVGRIAIVVVELGSFMLTWYASYFYLMAHYPPFQHCIFAVAQMFASTQMSVSFMSLIVQAEKVRNSYDEIQGMFDQCKTAKMALAYLRVNYFCERFIKWTLCAVPGLFSLGMYFLAAAGAVFYYSRDGRVETERLFLPLQLELPFDLNTIGGYNCALAIHVILGAIYLTAVVSFGSLILTMGLFTGAFHTHFELVLDEINEMVDTGASRTKLSMRSKTYLIEAINLHNQAKTIFALCGETLGVTIFSQVVSAALLTSSLQFEIASATETMDLRASSSLIGSFSSIGNIFLFCFIGSYATEQFSRYAATTYELHWYKLPIRLQPFVRLIIADAQRQRNFNGLGIFDLNLSLFAQIMRASWSYFLMFRSL